MLQLYTYFRSSAAYRVRIALNLKSLSFEAVPVHLLRGGGEQHDAAFVARSPAHLIPVLRDGALTLTQSLAIIEYLEETHPEPALLPRSPAQRAQVRAIALGIACDIHPLNNLRVIKYLEKTLAASPEQRTAWSRHWIEAGFAAIERLLEKAGTERFCFGDAPSLADCCLVPQVFNAKRIGCALDSYPRIVRIYEHCARLPPFERAAPGAQSDAE
ncbi:MAG TPA: maleylacetoacetate isomerase [Steroidobacteraceae bacterium]|nr:maleylacetoacetate isomerase [Steroidobacteraceae bacterium]